MDPAVWDARYAAEGQVWSREPNQFVEAELAGLDPGRALDLACGEGRNAIWLARQGWTVTAIDYSTVAVDRARGLAGDLPVTWVVGDVLTTELPEVELVVIAYLQLVEDERRAAVRRGFDALRPGGTFFMVGHDTTNITEGSGGPQDETVLYTAEDLLADLDGRPLRVERAERVPRHVVVPDEHGAEQGATAWDALLRVVRE